MYTDIRRLPVEMRDWLTRWEADHGIPVRVLNGAWRAGAEFANNNWTDRQVRDSEFTRQQASAQGLTIISAATTLSDAWLDYGPIIPTPPGLVEGAYTFADLYAGGYEDDYADPNYPDRTYDMGQHTPIVWHDANGHNRRFGEIGDRIVYFWWALETSTPQRWDYDALFASLEDAIDSEAAARRMEALLAASFTNFMEFMSEGRINSQINALRENIAAQERNISSWQTQLAAAISQASGQSAQIEAMMAAAARTEEEWRQQYELVINNPAVESLLFRNNSLRIVTHPLTLQGREQYEGQTRWLGRFQIDVHLTNYSIRIHNLDNPQSGRDHPHVPGGAPCFGGNASEFTQLIGNGQFGIFVELIIQWLENYNPRDDWGRYASLWFNQPDADPRFQPGGDTENVETVAATTQETTVGTPA